MATPSMFQIHREGNHNKNPKNPPTPAGKGTTFVYRVFHTREPFLSTFLFLFRPSMKKFKSITSSPSPTWPRSSKRITGLNSIKKATHQKHNYKTSTGKLSEGSRPTILSKLISIK